MKANKRRRILPVDLMWAAQGAQTKADFERVMKVIARKDKFFHRYLMRDTCPPEKWVHYASLRDGYSTFGHRTSNIVESVNGAWMGQRALHPYRFFDATMMWIFEKQSTRRYAALEWAKKGWIVTPWARQLMKKEMYIAAKANLRYLIYIGSIPLCAILWYQMR